MDIHGCPRYSIYIYHGFSSPLPLLPESESWSYDWGPHTMLALCRYAKPRSKPWTTDDHSGSKCSSPRRTWCTKYWWCSCEKSRRPHQQKKNEDVVTCFMFLHQSFHNSCAKTGSGGALEYSTQFASPPLSRVVWSRWLYGDPAIDVQFAVQTDTQFVEKSGRTPTFINFDGWPLLIFHNLSSSFIFHFHFRWMWNPSSQLAKSLSPWDRWQCRCPFFPGCTTKLFWEDGKIMWEVPTIMRNDLIYIHKKSQKYVLVSQNHLQQTSGNVESAWLYHAISVVSICFHVCGLKVGSSRWVHVKDPDDIVLASRCVVRGSGWRWLRQQHDRADAGAWPVQDCGMCLLSL